MRIPSIVLGTIGKCIYCQSVKEPLQTEHIVPKSLYGQWQLHKASCKDCAVITSKFERDILRNLLLPLRTKLNFPTYHKGGRPKTFPLTYEREGQKITENVPLRDYPIPVSLPIFKLPAYIEKRKHKKGIELTGNLWRLDGVKLAEEFAKKHDTKTLSFTFTYNPLNLARLLAKIAYGFTVAQYSLDAMEEVYVLPAIMDKPDDIGYWVGCSENKGLTPIKEIHKIDLTEFSNGEIHCKVRLLAPLNTPEYLVVVGRISKT